jgi:hypothetical protein
MARRLACALTTVVLAGCASRTPAKTAPTTSTTQPPHAIAITLLLAGAYPWEAEPAGCHGAPPIEDLKIGTPVTVSAGGKIVASGAFNRSKNWIASCTLTADIGGVPAADSYTIRVGDYGEHTVSYKSVAETWRVLIEEP